MFEPSVKRGIPPNKFNYDLMKVFKPNQHITNKIEIKYRENLSNSK